MIKVNNRDSEWYEGMTVRSLLNDKKYTFRMIIVKINGKVIKKDQYDTHLINNADNVLVIHMISGG